MGGDCEATGRRVEGDTPGVKNSAGSCRVSANFLGNVPFVLLVSRLASRGLAVIEPDTDISWQSREHLSKMWLWEAARKVGDEKGSGS